MNRIRCHIPHVGIKKLALNEGDWSISEKLILAKHYPSTDNEVLAERLKRTTRSITSKANAMGLLKLRAVDRSKYAAMLDELA